MNIHRKKNNGGITTKSDVKHIRVVIADEQPNIRKTLRLLLASEPDIEIIGEANNGFDMLDMIGNLHPDIIILGLNASNTLEIVQLVNQRFPGIAIVIPRKSDNEDRITEMMRAGVKIHVMKSSSAAKIVDTIRKVNPSQRDLSAPVSHRAAGRDAPYLEKSTVDPYDVLTKREREVFALVAGRLTNAMIAQRLSISQRTVEVHRAHMLRKLGLHNQYEQLRNYVVERKILLDTDQHK